MPMDLVRLLHEWGVEDNEVISYAESMLEDVQRSCMEVEEFVVAVRCTIPTFK